MTTHRRWILAAALCVGACNSTTPAHTQPDLGLHDSGAQVDAFVPQTDSGPADDAFVGDDAGCSAPSTLHPPSMTSSSNIYCPFGMLPDGGHSLYCNASSQHCCEPTAGTSMCSPTATPCGATDLDWQCQDPGADCPGSMHCCGTGTLVLASSPSCGNFASHFTGTHCAASCATGTEIVMCTNDTECPTGQHCTPFRTHGAQVGGCM
jgi:hypothetical protein